VPGLADDIVASAALVGVPSALAAARDAIDALLRDRGLRRTGADLAAEALLRGAAASAVLEGSRTDTEQLRRGEGDDLAASAARLNAGLLTLVPVVRRSPVQALARMHTLAARSRVDPDQLGRPRASHSSAQRLQALSVALLSPAVSRAPALVVACVAHAEIAAYRPFESCNGLVGRALERLILVARGVDPACVLVPEAGHRALATQYRTSLARYAQATPEARREWLLHCARASTVAAELSPLRTCERRPRRGAAAGT
jgi:hypothetical protein